VGRRNRHFQSDNFWKNSNNYYFWPQHFNPKVSQTGLKRSTQNVFHGCQATINHISLIILTNQKSLITCRHHKLVFPFYHDTSNNITLYPSYGKDGPAPCWEKIIEKRFTLVRVWALKANPLTTQTCTLHVPKIYVAQNDYGGPQLSHQNQILTANSNHSQQIQNTHSKLKSPTVNYKLLTVTVGPQWKQNMVPICWAQRESY